MSDQSQGRGWWLASDGRWYPPESHPSYGATRLPAHIKASAGIGLALVLAAVLVVSLGRDSGSDARGETRPRANRDVNDFRLPNHLVVPESRPLPTATLTVFSDGCGVIRSDLADEPDGLTWSIADTDGFQVLGRNAANETRYRYFQSGTYTVELTAWDGSSYVPISNTVTIHC